MPDPRPISRVMPPFPVAKKDATALRDRLPDALKPTPRSIKALGDEEQLRNSLSPQSRSMREQVGDTFRGIGTGEGPLGTLAGLTDIGGAVQGGNDMWDALKNGRPLGPAMGSAALGLIPFVGGTLKKAGKVAKAVGVPERIAINMGSVPNAAWEAVDTEGKLVKRFKNDMDMSKWKDKHGYAPDPREMGIFKRGTPTPLPERTVAPADREANLAKFLEGLKAPETMFHGTGGDFDVFQSGRADPRARGGIHGEGTWMTSNPDRASEHAEYADGQPNVMKVHPSIKNPARLGQSEMAYHTKAELQALGHDGVYDLETGDWVAFEPNQIKSAIGNKGTFDPTKASILAGAAGTVGLSQLMQDEKPRPKSLPSKPLNKK